MFNLPNVQEEMKRHSIDSWLIYDFRGSNPILWQILGFKKVTTRRIFFVIPKDGDVTIIVHALDKELFYDVGFNLIIYTTWEELHNYIKEVIKLGNRVAMEYSPNASIPTLSYVDAGTFELLRSFKAEIISSADLFQKALASWSKDGFQSHIKACQEVAEIKDMAFAFIRHKNYSNQELTEFDVQQFILEEFRKRNMETEDDPIVAVNKNSGSPHYEPSKLIHSSIKSGDWIMIDLWARYPGDHNVFADITWVAYLGKQVPPMHQNVFDIVKNARNAVVTRLKDAWQKDEHLRGWELDEVARSHITKSGYGKYFTHRTGHSMGPGATLHALGVNLDNFETHDTRTILPGVGFSIEPGIYLENFGVRLEINVYIDPSKGPVVTTPIQDEIILLA